MVVVNAMTGLLSRLESTVSRKPVRLSCRSVCTRPGSSRVLDPLVIDHTATQSTTAPRTIVQRGMPRVGSSGASAVGSTGAFPEDWPGDWAVVVMTR